MNIERISRLWAAALTLTGLGAFWGCLSDESDPGADSGGSAGSGGSAAGAGGSGGSAAGSGGAGAGSGGSAGGATTIKCAAPIVLAASKPAIADFEDYVSGTDLATWYFSLGGDSATGIQAGPFAYGDNYSVDPTGKPEAFAMVEGNASIYGLSISDTLAEEYGGGMGLWLSDCIDASAFTGISFWVRGNSPTGTAKISLNMKETTSAMPDMPADPVGTCAGTEAQCIHPGHTFAVTADWTQVEVPWSMFMPGSANTLMVAPDGNNIWQIQFDVGLMWLPDATGVYVPTPGEYEFVIDDMTFY